jgi:hypothetical protein
VQRVADGRDESDAVDTVRPHLRDQALDGLEPRVEVIVGVDDHHHLGGARRSPE